MTSAPSHRTASATPSPSPAKHSATSGRSAALAASAPPRGGVDSAGLGWMRAVATEQTAEPEGASISMRSPSCPPASIWRGSRGWKHTARMVPRAPAHGRPSLKMESTRPKLHSRSNPLAHATSSEQPSAAKHRPQTLSRLDHVVFSGRTGGEAAPAASHTSHRLTAPADDAEAARRPSGEKATRHALEE